MINAKLQEPDAPSQYAATKTIAHKLGIGHNTLQTWCNKAALNTGKEFSSPSDVNAEIRRLKRENAELRRANEILKTASAFFAAELDRPTTT